MRYLGRTKETLGVKEYSKEEIEYFNKRNLIVPVTINGIVSSTVGLTQVSHRLDCEESNQYYWYNFKNCTEEQQAEFLANAPEGVIEFLSAPYPEFKELSFNELAKLSSEEQKEYFKSLEESKKLVEEYLQPVKLLEIIK